MTEEKAIRAVMAMERIQEMKNHIANLYSFRDRNVVSCEISGFKAYKEPFSVIFKNIDIIKSAIEEELLWAEVELKKALDELAEL